MFLTDKRYIFGNQCLDDDTTFYRHHNSSFVVKRTHTINGRSYGVYSLGDETYEPLCIIEGTTKLNYKVVADKCDDNKLLACNLVRQQVIKLAKYFDQHPTQYPIQDIGQFDLMPGSVKDYREFTLTDFDDESEPNLEKFGLVEGKYADYKPRQLFNINGVPYLLNIIETRPSYNGYLFRLYKLNTEMTKEQQGVG